MSQQFSKFPQQVWDGLSSSLKTINDDKVDYQIADQHSAEIQAVESYLKTYADLLRLVGNPDTILGVNHAGLALEYKTLVAGANITITHAPGSVTIATSGSSSPLTTKGDLYGFSTVNARVPVGANGSLLTADSTQSLGLNWSPVNGTATNKFLTEANSVLAWNQIAAGDVPTLNQNTTGSAGTLSPGRTINGVAFDGSINIVVPAAAGTLTGTTLNATVITSSLTSIGIIGTGVWNGTKVGLAYGGTNADLSATGGAANYLKQSSSGGAITVGTIPASDIASGAALTKTDDTNVTLTLGGTPATSLLVAASITVNWAGTLAVARGGIGVGTLAVNGVLYGNTTSAVQALAVNSTGTNKYLQQVSSGAPSWVQVSDADISFTDITTGNVSTATHGFAPKAPNDATKFLNGVGAYSTPASGAAVGNPAGGAQVDLTGANGSAATALRTDCKLILDQTIAPSMSGAWTFTNKTAVTITQAVIASAAPATAFTLTTGAHTALTASVEFIAANFDYATNQPQWATGALTTQRWTVFGIPKPKFVGASTITNAATVAIAGAPDATGTNCTITNPYSLWIQAGNTALGGHLLFPTDGTYNIGSSNSTNRPANIYVMGTLFAYGGNSVISAGDIQIANVHYLYWGSRASIKSTADGNISFRNNADSADSIINFSNAVMSGKATTYNNVATVGMGVIPLYGLDSRTGLTVADGAATTLYTATAANQVYRISADIFATAAVTGTANYTLTWTENGTTQTSTVSATAINVLGTVTNMIRPDNATAITAQLTGTFTGTFSVVGTVERVA